MTQHEVLLLQKAIKEQNLNLDEIDKQVLGTDNEKQNPNVEKPNEQSTNWIKVGSWNTYLTLLSDIKSSEKAVTL